MGGWLRVGFILFVVIVDDVLREVLGSILALKELLFEHLASAVVYKARSLWRGSRP